jgi:hypothetical protein
MKAANSDGVIPRNLDKKKRGNTSSDIYYLIQEMAQYVVTDLCDEVDSCNTSKPKLLKLRLLQVEIILRLGRALALW